MIHCHTMMGDAGMISQHDTTIDNPSISLYTLGSLANKCCKQSLISLCGRSCTRMAACTCTVVINTKNCMEYQSLILKIDSAIYKYDDIDHVSSVSCMHAIAVSLRFILLVNQLTVLFIRRIDLNEQICSSINNN